MPPNELAPVLAIWSPTDPGAIGAGNLWFDVGSGGTDAPRLRVRNRRDTGWCTYVQTDAPPPPRLA
jgi:hypothetical protein